MVEAATRPTTERVGGTGLLLLGGGARAAYSVGFLRSLARELPDGQHFTVIAGVSAGAINAAFLASRPGTLRERMEALAALWEELEPGSVMDIGTLDLLKKIVLWGSRLMGGGTGLVPVPRGLVDCRPLEALLRRELANGDDRLVGLSDRLRDGPLRSLLMPTTSYTTGESVVWSQGVPLSRHWNRPGRRFEATELSVRHVMASASLPLLFPAVKLGNEWHGDGEVRLDSPLSPLIALGVDRILAVSTHHASFDDQHEGFAESYPPPGQVAGTVVNSAFIHHLTGDVRALRRVNHLVDEARGRDSVAGGAFRKIGLYVMRPSCDPEAVAGRRERTLPWALRWMIRGLGTHSTASPGLLSLISFQPDYIRELMSVGERDAQRESDSIRDFLEDEAVETHRASSDVDELRLR